MKGDEVFYERCKRAYKELLLSVWLLIFAVLGTSTMIRVTTLRRDYLEAIEWRSEALAQGSLIINITQAAQYILNVQELLETEALQCVDY